MRITIDVPDAIVPRIQAAFNALHGTTNVKAKIIEYVQQVVAGYEADVAAENARKSAEEKAKSEITAA
jgi:hypothetical protein